MKINWVIKVALIPCSIKQGVIFQIRRIFSHANKGMIEARYIYCALLLLPQLHLRSSGIRSWKLESLVLDHFTKSRWA